MKVAINGSFFIPKGGGIKEYIYNLVYNIDKLITREKFEIILYVPKGFAKYALQNLPDEITIKETPFSDNDTIKRSLFEYFFWRKEEKKEKFDLFHSPFLHAPVLRSAKVVITVHDLRICHYPKTYSKLRYLFLKYKVPFSLNHCDHIIAISNFTKQDIINFYQINSEKITVIHEAIDKKRFIFDEKKIKNITIPQEITTNSYILYVSHLEPRKNHIRLINAYSQLKTESNNKDIKLVLVGQKSQSADRVLSKINQNESIIYMNFVQYETLIWLYKNAKLFVFPSYFEGFGFPPLEAATLGTISAVSRIASIPEICGEAAFYFDPFDEQNMSEVINNALNNEQERSLIKSKLQKNLDRFSWDKNAKETIDIYKLINK